MKKIGKEGGLCRLSLRLQIVPRKFRPGWREIFEPKLHQKHSAFLEDWVFLSHWLRAAHWKWDDGENRMVKQLRQELGLPIKYLLRSRRSDWTILTADTLNMCECKLYLSLGSQWSKLSWNNDCSSTPKPSPHAVMVLRDFYFIHRIHFFQWKGVTPPKIN